jgi:5'-3' exonuclease
VPVTIHTNDFDFHQLSVLPLLTLKGVRPKDGIPAKFVSLYKAMCGDASDKIPGIPGFGDKTFAKFREVWPVLDQAMRDRDAATIRSQPFTPKPMLWLSSDENMELLFAYHQITRMLDVPLDLIEQHTRPGRPDQAAAQSLFSRFML